MVDSASLCAMSGDTSGYLDRAVGSMNNPHVPDPIRLSRDDVEKIDDKVRSYLRACDIDGMREALVESGGITQAHFDFYTKTWAEENESWANDKEILKKLRELYFSCVQFDLINGTRFSVFLPTGDLLTRATIEGVLPPAARVTRADLESAVRHRPNAYAAIGFNYIDRLLREHGYGPEKVRLVDWGSGSGIVLRQAAERGFAHVVGVELDGDMFRLSQRNMRTLGLSEKVNLVQANARDFREYGPSDGIQIFTTLFYNSFGPSVLKEAFLNAAEAHEAGVLGLNKLLPEQRATLRDAANALNIDLRWHNDQPEYTVVSADPDKNFELASWGLGNHIT
jgi:hypothetical protein